MKRRRALQEVLSTGEGRLLLRRATAENGLSAYKAARDAAASFEHRQGTFAFAAGHGRR